MAGISYIWMNYSGGWNIVQRISGKYDDDSSSATLNLPVVNLDEDIDIFNRGSRKLVEGLLISTTERNQLVSYDDVINSGNEVLLNNGFTEPILKPVSVDFESFWLQHYFGLKEFPSSTFADLGGGALFEGDSTHGQPAATAMPVDTFATEMEITRRLSPNNEIESSVVAKRPTAIIGNDKSLSRRSSKALDRRPSLFDVSHTHNVVMDPSSSFARRFSSISASLSGSKKSLEDVRTAGIERRRGSVLMKRASVSRKVSIDDKVTTVTKNVLRSSFFPQSSSTNTSMKKTTTTAGFNPVTLDFKRISSVVTSPTAFKNIRVLENHPSLKHIFGRLEHGMEKCLDEFKSWRNSLLTLKGLEPIKLPLADLLDVIVNVKPPVNQNDEDSDDSEDDSSGVYTKANELAGSNKSSAAKASLDVKGLWYRGYELTALQTMILSEALFSNSTRSLAEVVFSYSFHFLAADGHIVSHSDEVLEIASKDEDNSHATKDEDEDHSEGEDQFNVNTSATEAMKRNSHSNAEVRKM